MRILHTSDWHLGATIGGRKRYDEGEAFLSWLSGVIEDEKAEVLIMAGDVFDSGTPSNRALELYYRFLGRMARSSCRHIIITAGNHDSPSLLAAPRELLSALSIHVVGSATHNPSEQVFLLSDKTETPSLIVCAVPYLRDSDIRTSQPGEMIGEKNAYLIEGIREHYQEVCKTASDIRDREGGQIPIVATGHLFAAGGQSMGDDGVRDRAIGNILQVGTDVFPSCIDYLALGHLHQPQLVGGRADRRYCGAPLVMGFGESTRQKEVIIADIQPGIPVAPIPLKVPHYRRYARITGTGQSVLEQIREMQFSKGTTWVEVLLTDPVISLEEREELFRVAAGSQVEIVRVKNTGVRETAMRSTTEEETLEELDPMEVFTRRLEAAGDSGDDAEDLIVAYQEILTEVLQEDSGAE